MSSDEQDPNDMLSERDVKTRFVPQSDDEEVLWTVMEITGERGHKYKVKWAGIDPETGKPWAQSWVAKRDCTDDLVVAWRAKQKGKGKGRQQTRLGSGKGKGRERGESAQSSRRSGSTSKPASTTTTGTSGTGKKKTRRLASASAEASSSRSRLDSVEPQLLSSPPKPPPKSKTSATAKRKRDLEGPAATTVTAQNGSGAPDDEQAWPSRPLKKRKTIVEVLLPPLSTDDEDELAAGAHTRTVLQNRTPAEKNANPLVLVVSSGKESAPPKAKTKEKKKSEGKGKGKSVHRSDVRPKDIGSGSRVSDSRQELRQPHSKTKTKDVPRHEERVSDIDESQDEQPRPPPSKSKSTSKRELLSLEHIFDFSEPEVEAPVRSSKVGPPRGVKRQQTQSKPKDKRGPSHAESRKDDSADECIPTTEPKGQSEKNVSSSGGAMSMKVAKRGPLSLKYVFESSEEEAEAPVLSTKIGPPRGAKRQQMRSKSNSHDERGLSRTITPQEDHPAYEPIPAAESKDQPENDAPSPGGAMSTEQDPVPSPMLTSPLRISIPPVPPSVPVPSPVLSPGAVARLELFDRMVADEPQPNAFHVPDDDDFNIVDTLDPPGISNPPLSPSKTKPSKSDVHNGLIVPETQSSGHSPSRSQTLPKPPSLKPPPANGRSLRQPLDLPTIAVITASANSSAASLQELQAPPPKRPVSPSRLSKTQKPGIKFVPRLSPNRFRSMTNMSSRANDAGAPSSSIESFTSPQRVDKGKQRAVEGNDGVQNSQSEEDGAGNTRNRQIRRTDSELQRKGKELFDRVQLAREAERQKGKKKQLKTIDDIVNATTAPFQPRGSPPPFVGDDEFAIELQLEEIIDLSAGANSTTLESPERSEAKPLTPGKRERLRIDLRQEEEESTQEAMDAYPHPPTKTVEERELLNGGDAQVPPKSPSKSPFIGNTEDADPVEQPSLDIQLASVIVQPSQGQQIDDMDTDPSLTNRPASSPPRPIPENLTDSPERRLGEALSLLNVKSEEIQRLERELANACKNLEGLHTELVDVRQSTEPTASVRAVWEAERAQWTQEQTKWENDCSVWEVQRKEASEEKERLLARVAELSGAAVQAEETRAKLSELEAERVAWIKEREALLNDSTQHKGELAVLANVTGEHDRERATWEVERAQWVEERAKWETERAALQEKDEGLSASIGQLTASVNSLTSAKASAEKDRDFFREQYMQASGFVSSVRAENVELGNKAKIAEGQAQEGVAAIKAMFEGRMKALRADVDRWKSLTELLQEKDARTNDGIRQRAALVPDLAALCGRLSKEKKSFEAEVRKLGIAQHRGVTQRNRLYFQILVLKKERASLRSKLSQLAKGKMVESTGDCARERSLPCSLAAPAALPLPPLPPSPAPPPMIIDDPESMDPNDMDPPMSQPTTEVSFDEPALFPCMWRPQLRDQCQQVFDTKEDLERHVQEHFNDMLAL